MVVVNAVWEMGRWFNLWFYNLSSISINCHKLKLVYYHGLWCLRVYPACLVGFVWADSLCDWPFESLKQAGLLCWILVQMIQTEIIQNPLITPSWMYFLLPNKVITISNHYWKTTIFLSNWIKVEEYLDEMQSWSQMWPRIASCIQGEPSTK